MNTEIMIEYLKWFDGQISGRKVILIMDNFSAHKAAFEYLNSNPSTMLKNTKVIFLPPNVTSLHQPLNQGIIHSWKSHYRKKWLKSGLTSSITPIFKILISTKTTSRSNSGNGAELVTIGQTVAWQCEILVENIPSFNEFVSPNSREALDDLNTSEKQLLEEMAELFDTEKCDENNEEDAEGLESGANFKEVELHEKIAAREVMIKMGGAEC
ncbi:hypothetical protein K3495_g1668 [Podosphaera aphanis]|nr:hypothetical protein K3495_g1668 [Podosphaera aphanis]